MKHPLKITYLLESTQLWGGTKVALEHAELLSEQGHIVTILSKDRGPDWYPLKLRITRASQFDSESIPQSDIVVGTYWPTVRDAFTAKKGTTVHLCQGYEGDFAELQHVKDDIDEVYRLNIPKLTVSPHLKRFLFERFGSNAFYIGQTINKNIFYPIETERSGSLALPLNLLVVGPYEVNFKNIPPSLKGIAVIKKMGLLPVKLLRVSQFPLSLEEKSIVRPDSYYCNVPYHKMGDIYRKADLFISMSKEAEGFGLPALEAMACGVPSILSRISSYMSLGSPADYALFVDKPDQEDVADAIIRLAGDRIRYAYLRKRGLDVAAEYTPERMVTRLEKALIEILTSHPKTS